MNREALRRIEQAAAEGWEELDLAGLELTELPPEIGQLWQLKRLILGKWERENLKIAPLASRQYDTTMTRKQKLLRKILGSTQHIAFSDRVLLSEAFGFRLSRISSSHHIFEHPNVPEPLNLQNKNGQAKSYQVRQFLRLIEQYNLTLNHSED
jgi:hypothetical protein